MKELIDRRAQYQNKLKIYRLSLGSVVRIGKIDGVVIELNFVSATAWFELLPTSNGMNLLGDVHISADRYMPEHEYPTRKEIWKWRLWGRWIGQKRPRARALAVFIDGEIRMAHLHYACAVGAL